ncbi:pyridoxal-phosphate dependent enzyme [Streptomyces sp. R21]|uniref:Pyridoxal-phosphate dependent enzyme n=1 Tax=Streptomyces sp. R21 TaxID=3238627 RepID=A0AB39PCB6_9ACTN
MRDVEQVFRDAVRDTPLRRVRCRYRGGTVPFGLKMEAHGSSGSVKDRTAVGLLRQLHQERPLVPGTVVVESTSGNLGLAMARILPEIGCEFLAVVDLKTPGPTMRALRDMGARLVVVDEPDGRGGYLLSRLETVRRLCAENPGYRWTNQYENPAGPRMHSRTTGPEIVAQAGPELSAVYAPVSTGGTFAGISAHLRDARPDVARVAVDVTGSAALYGDPGQRRIPGIGASRPSLFITPGDYDRAVLVEDAEAMAVCRILHEDLGLAVGGSSGCTVRALLADHEGPDGGLSVCLAADGGEKYRETIYSDEWTVAQGIHEDVLRAVKQLRYEGLSFTWARSA